MNKYSKIKAWAKLIIITGGAQALVQAIGLISGILIIRIMPIQEYAWYTIANTMLGMLTILSDGGISSGVMAQGGKVWEDKNALGIIMATGMDLRKKFAIGSLLVSAPILVYLLLHQNATWLTAILITLSLIPAFYASLSDNLLEIPLKLHQNILPLQKNQIVTAIGRLILISITLLSFPFTVIALLGNGIPRFLANLNLQKINRNYIYKTHKTDIKVKKEILSLVARVLPGAVYYCISGQITIWLLSLFGNTTTIAQLGGLGRLSILLSLFSVLFGTLIVPRFAKIKIGDGILLKRFMQIEIAFVLLCVTIVIFAYLFSPSLLWILGKEYENLSNALLLNIIASCIGLMAGFSFGLFTSRGWAIYPYLSIPFNILSIISGIFIFDVTSLNGVLYFTIFTSLMQYFINTIFCFYKIIKLRV